MCILGCTRPDIRDINSHVAPNIPAEKWKDLGLELLNGNIVELGNIEADVQGTNQRVIKIFEKWLAKHNATWSELIAVLEKIHLNYLADNIGKNFLSITGKFMCMHIHIHCNSIANYH